MSYVLLVIWGASGFSLATYLFFKKRRRIPFACPLHFRCETVIFSRYAKFLGIPVEIMGIAYYALVTVIYVLLLAFPILIVPAIAFWMGIITILAFLFSIYLTLVQALALKAWCSWCLISASICTIIFAILWLH